MWERLITTALPLLLIFGVGAICVRLVLRQREHARASPPSIASMKLRLWDVASVTIVGCALGFALTRKPEFAVWGAIILVLLPFGLLEIRKRDRSE